MHLVAGSKIFVVGSMMSQQLCCGPGGIEG